MRSTRGAQRREVKVVPSGVSVFTDCEKMPVHSAIHFRWPLTAQLRSSCLGVIDLQPMQAVDCRSRSTVYGSPAFCAVARPVCHCWCDSSHLVVVVHVLLSLVLSASLPPHAIHSRPTFCGTCCPQQSMLPSVASHLSAILLCCCSPHQHYL